MHICYYFNIVFLTTALVTVTSAHGVITSATGDAGGQGTALAVDAATPRDGTRRRPFQQDTTVFEEEDDDNQGEARTGCGMTIQAGEINIPTAMQSVITQNGGLPQVSPGGELTMTLHQVNGDGAGPYECMIDQTGTGASFTPITVTQNVPGRDGRDRDGSETDFPLVAQMPANMACTGTAGATAGICMVRCQNPANAGPFGGCVPVQQAGAGAGAGASGSATAAASNTPANSGAPNTLPAGNAAPTNTAAAGNANANGNGNGNNAGASNGAGGAGGNGNNRGAGAGTGGNNTPGGPRGAVRQAPKRFRA